jgi:hypothetical protein
MIPGRAIFAAFLIFFALTVSSAQQPDAMITFGGLRVPVCAVSSDAGYGLTAANPIQIGGGPSYADSRMARFVGSLRGPNGETARITGRGSLFAPVGYMDQPTILDNYRIAAGDQTVSLFVDDYHYSIPKAPMGFTCGGPLVTALGVPPLDPMVLASSMVRLAIEEGSAQDFPAVPLDASTPRGFLYDQFAMIAQRARAAANSGMPMDSKKPPTNLDPAGLVALAFPVACGGRTITPQRVEIAGPQGPLPQSGTIIKGEDLDKMFPGMKVPADSIAARFRQAQVSGIKIAYSEPCDTTPAEVSLPVRVEPPQFPLRPLPLPTGVVEAEPAVFLQVIVDPLGEFASITYIGGPKSLAPSAMEALRKIRGEPVRLNGVGIQNPAVIPVLFQ